MVTRVLLVSVCALSLYGQCRAQSIGKIAFDSDRDGNREIYLMDEDGSNQVRLTDNPAEDLHPILSPDGTRIAFVSNRDGVQSLPDGGSGIYVMGADGSNPVNLTQHLAGLTDYGHAVWSPAGDRIAFEAIADGNSDIYLMHVDGSNLIRLTDSTIRDHFPSWSPVDGRIAYTCGWSPPRLCLVDVAGGEPDVIIDMAFDPVWSPDGARIVYVGINDRCCIELMMVQADGSDHVLLTDNGIMADWAPNWSPDGGRIIFSTDRDGNFEIYAMDADGSNPVNLSNNPAADHHPHWSIVSSATAVLQSSWGAVKEDVSE